MLGTWIILILAIATAVVFGLQKQYRAEAMLMIDTRVEHVSDFKSVVSTPFTTQDAAPVMRSEVQILMSPDLAGKVIDKLDLANNPSFQPHPSRFQHFVGDAVAAGWAACSKLLGPSCATAAAPVASDADHTRTALISAYLGRLAVFNDGKSFTLSVSFEDTDPKLAALIVNTHADFYLADQRAFKRRASERGVAWIDQQIARLGSELTDKEQTLAHTRQSAGLVAAQGSTMVAQQVAQIGVQLAQARADLAQRQARLAGAQGAARRGSTAVQSDVLNSPLIQSLREQESLAQQALADASQRYDANFPALQQLRARTEEINRRIASETQRITTASDGDVGVAQQRVSELEAAMEGLRKDLISQDNATSRVTEMERDVGALRVVYQGLMARQQELEAQAGTEDSDARLVSRATVPLTAFFPNKAVLLSVAGLLALVSGVALAFLIDKPSRGIATPGHLDDAVGMLSLHALPLVPKGRRGKRSLPDYLLDAPKTEFAEAIRSLRGDIAAIGRRKPVQVLAITSALPQEGKTTVAVALARSMAASGLHVLLVDCDLRRPRTIEMIGASRGEFGIVSVLQGRAPLSAATLRDPRTTLDVLPVEQQVSNPQDMLSSPAFRTLLKEARTRYDFVILDTPPQGAVADPLVIAEQADVALLLVHWKSTPASLVRSTMQAFHKRGVPFDGVFLNGVDHRELTRDDVDLRKAYQSTRSYYVET